MRLRAAREALPCPWCLAPGPHSVGGHVRDGVIVPSCGECGAVATIPEPARWAKLVEREVGDHTHTFCPKCDGRIVYAVRVLLGDRVVAHCPSCETWIGDDDGR